MSRIDVPARKSSGTKMLAYRYLKRTIYRFIESLSKAAVKP